MKKILLATVMIVACATGPGRAAVLHDNGVALGESFWCQQQTGCGFAPFTVVDDFSLASSAHVTGLTYNSYDGASGPLTNYVSTVYSIWNVNPAANIGAVPIASGTVVGSTSAGAASSTLITVSGLAIDLAAGTYWLGLSNTITDGNATYAFSANSGNVSQFRGDNTVNVVGLNEEAFTILGEVTGVPEPASLTLLGLGLLGLGAARRR